MLAWAHAASTARRNVRRVAAAAVALLALVAAGCGEADPPEPPDPCDALTGMPTVELGTGETSFVPLEDGDTASLVCGPQGGYHVWASVRVANMDASQVTLDFEQAFLGAPELDGRSGLRANLAASGGERVGITAFFGRGIDDPTGFDPLGRDGQTFVFTVIARDGCGNVAADGVMLVLDASCARAR